MRLSLPLGVDVLTGRKWPVKFFRKHGRGVEALTRPLMVALYTLLSLTAVEVICIVRLGRVDRDILTAMISIASLIVGATLGVRGVGWRVVRKKVREAEPVLTIDELIRIGKNKLEELMEKVEGAEPEEYVKLMTCIATYLRTNAALLQARDKLSGKAESRIDLAKLLSSLKKLVRV